MAILRGFPPSNTISPTTHIPMTCGDCYTKAYCGHGMQRLKATVDLNEDRTDTIWIYLCDTCVYKRKLALIKKVNYGNNI